MLLKLHHNSSNTGYIDGDIVISPRNSCRADTDRFVRHLQFVSKQIIAPFLIKSTIIILFFTVVNGFI